MFFNLESGMVEQQGSDLYCWVHKGDRYIWFASSDSQISVVMSDQQLSTFCQFLTQVGSEYADYQDDNLFIALEDDDEGSRNLCIYDDRVQAIFNIRSNCTARLAQFLKEQRS